MTSLVDPKMSSDIPGSDHPAVPDDVDKAVATAEQDSEETRPEHVGEGHDHDLTSSEDGTQNYEHEALSSTKHIRRLILEPGKDDDPLVGHLEAVDLRDTLYTYPYEAISYVWSTDIMDQTIVIDGKTMFITSRLQDALRQTRYTDRPRALWADSICINQADNHEKEHQVGMMGRIYENSDCTLICLSTQASEDQEALNEGDRIAASGVLESCEQTAPSCGQSGLLSPQPDELPFLDKWRQSWSAILRLPWFQRGWVIQEVVLGPKCCVLWAGIQISWAKFLATYHLSVSPISRRWGIPTTLSPLYYSMTTTLEMLHMIRSQALTDPKDRIYASMALPTSDGAMPAIQPDYSEASYLNVYQDFAVKYLEKNCNLDLLSFVEHQHDCQSGNGASDPRLRSFPSWAPRWDRGREVKSLFVSTHRKFQESGTQQMSDRSSFSILDGKSTLRVKGVIFDSIGYVSEKVIPNLKSSAAFDHVLSLWTSLAQKSETHHKRPGLAFLDALSGGTSLDDVEEWVKSLNKLAHFLESEQPERLNAKSDFESLALEVITERSCHRRVVLLSSGCYGLAPSKAQKDDTCAIIVGTRQPFALRKIPGRSDHHFEVIGAMYVHSKGISQETGLPMRLGASDKYEDWNDLGLPLEDIFLC